MIDHVQIGDRDPVPPVVLAEVYHLQFALADLLRALLTQDENYIVGNLGKLDWHRKELIRATWGWWPELRIGVSDD